jgi:hypothetical protein
MSVALSKAMNKLAKRSKPSEGWQRTGMSVEIMVAPLPASISSNKHIEFQMTCDQMTNIDILHCHDTLVRQQSADNSTRSTKLQGQWAYFVF